MTVPSCSVRVRLGVGSSYNKSFRTGLVKIYGALTALQRRVDLDVGRGWLVPFNPISFRLHHCESSDMGSRQISEFGRMLSSMRKLAGS